MLAKQRNIIKDSGKEYDAIGGNTIEIHNCKNLTFEVNIRKNC